MGRSIVPAKSDSKSALDSVSGAGAVAMVADHQEAQRLAITFGYTGELSVVAIEAQIRRDVRSTAEAALATGAGLLMLRQLTPHGEFTDRLQGLGVHERVARRLMTLAAKFAKTDSKSVLIAAAGSQSKLLELAILDDDDLDLIALGGTVKGLSLDSIDAMSARELREKLRDAEAELKVSQAAREKQRTRIDKLQAAQVRFAGLPPDDVLASMQDEAMSIMREARGAIDGRLRQAVRAIQNHGTESNEHDRFLAGLVAEIQHALTALREEAGLTDVAEGDLPGWLQGDEVAEAAAKARKGKGRQS